MDSTVKKKVFLEAFKSSAGNVSVACAKSNMPRSTFYLWKNEDPEFAESVDEVEQSLIDMAETQLLANIRKGHTAETIFFLKTKGRSRGYVEHMTADLTTNGKSIGGMNIDLSELSTEALLELRNAAKNQSSNNNKS